MWESVISDGCMTGGVVFMSELGGHLHGACQIIYVCEHSVRIVLVGCGGKL